MGKKIKNRHLKFKLRSRLTRTLLPSAQKPVTCAQTAVTSYTGTGNCEIKMKKQEKAGKHFIIKLQGVCLYSHACMDIKNKWILLLI